jgi:hypothetical protein
LRTGSIGRLRFKWQVSVPANIVVNLKLVCRCRHRLLLFSVHSSVASEYIFQCCNPKWIISKYSYLQCNSSAAAAFRPGSISSVLLKFLIFSLKSSHPFSDYLSIYRLVGEFVVRSITGGCAELSVAITGNALTGARANRRSSETRGGGERRGIDLIFFRAWGGVTVLLSIPLGIPSRPRRYHVPSGNLRRGLELREENKQSRGKCSSCFICFALSLFQLLPMRPIKPYNRHIFCSSMHPFRIQFKDQAHDSSESNCSEL